MSMLCGFRHHNQWYHRQFCHHRAAQRGRQLWSRRFYQRWSEHTSMRCGFRHHNQWHHQFATPVLRGGDDNFGVDVSIDDGVDTRACNAASGVTTSGTTDNFATTMLRGKQTLREFFSSSDSPLPCLRLAATLGMTAWLGLMMSMSSFFFCDV